MVSEVVPSARVAAAASASSSSSRACARSRRCTSTARCLGVSKTGLHAVRLRPDAAPAVRGGPNVLAVMCDNRFMKDPLDEAGGALGAATRQGGLGAEPEPGATVREGQRDDSGLARRPAGRPDPVEQPALASRRTAASTATCGCTSPIRCTSRCRSTASCRPPGRTSTRPTSAATRRTVHVEVPVENGRAAAASAWPCARRSSTRTARSVLALDQARVGARRAQRAPCHAVRPIATPAALGARTIRTCTASTCSLRVDGATVDDDRGAARHSRRALGRRRRALRSTAGTLKLHGLGPEADRRMAGPRRGAARLAALLHAAADEGGGRQLRALGPRGGGPGARSPPATGSASSSISRASTASPTRAARRWTLRASAFRDVVIYFRNNPSILIWEGGNQKVSREHARELRGIMDRYDPHGGRAYAHRRADQVTAEVMDVGIGTEGGREIADTAGGRGRVQPRGVAAPCLGRCVAAEVRLPGGEGADLPAHVGAVRRQPGRAVREEARRARAQRRRELDLLGLDQRRPRGRGGRPRERRGGRRAAAEGGVLRGGRDVPRRLRACTSSATGPIPPARRKTVYVVSNAEEVELLVNGSVGGPRAADRPLPVHIP